MESKGCSETESSTRAEQSWQPVIPGKAVGRDPESRRRKLDSRLRGNDEHDMPVIPGGVPRDPESRRRKAGVHGPKSYF
jgi:hypothetical protein